MNGIHYLSNAYLGNPEASLFFWVTSLLHSVSVFVCLLACLFVCLFVCFQDLFTQLQNISGCWQHLYLFFTLVNELVLGEMFCQLQHQCLMDVLS